MKIYGTYKRRSINEEGNLELTFEVSDYGSKRESENLEKVLYSLDVKQPKAKRTLNQNALFWQLIGEISIAEYGDRSEDMNIYCSLLEMTGAKCEYFECTKEAYEGFKEHFRVCKIMEERIHNGVQTVMIKAFFGSSKMNKEEMGKLIAKTLEYAEYCGLNTTYWNEQFER